MFTKFQKWALARCSVPALRLKPLGTRASHDDLVRRSFEISFDLCEQTDANLATTLINLGALDYLERDHEHSKGI